MLDIVKAQMLTRNLVNLQSLQLLLHRLSYPKPLKLRLSAWPRQRVIFQHVRLALSIAIDLPEANAQVVQKAVVAKCDDVEHGRQALQMDFLHCLVVYKPLRGRDIVEVSLAQLLALDDHVGQNEGVNENGDEAAHLRCLLCAVAAIDCEHHLVPEDVALF